MSPRDGHDVARALLHRANGDETLIRKVAADVDIPDAIVGFHAQQAAEKAIKAVLAANGVEYARTHALGYLTALLERHGIHGPDELAEVDELEPWAVEFRYEIDDAPPLDREAVLVVVSVITAWAQRVVGG